MYFLTINLIKMNTKGLLLYLFFKPKFLFITVLFFTSSLYSFGQIPEPDIFDWKESFDLTTKYSVSYNNEILPTIANDAIFWIDIQPREDHKTNTYYVKDKLSIYERFTTHYYKVNGEYYNYGLADMKK